MSFIWVYFLLVLGSDALADEANVEVEHQDKLQSTGQDKKYVEPEYLDMLRSEGRDEEFAALLGIEDVSLVRPQEGRGEDIMFTNVSPLGDILLTPQQLEESRNAINFEKYPSYKWPNGEIPYHITQGDFSSSQFRHIVNSINQLNSKMNNLKMVKRDKEKDYVQIISGKGCYSHLGKTGGQQPVSLQSNGCLSMGTIQHEMIHAAGMTHEHNRPDRDNYVKVLFDNIPDEWKSQYEKASSRAFISILKYDYYSVMHYSMKAPGGGLAFEFYDNSVDTSRVGQRNGVSKEDVKKLDLMYE